MQSKLACPEDTGQAQGHPMQRTSAHTIRIQPGESEGAALAPEQAHDDLATLFTAELARRSAAEQEQYRQRLPGDERASLELFRRAIQQRDALAWELIYEQWKGLLVHWLLQHPAASLALKYEPPESYITAALSKFWQATTARSRWPKQDFSSLNRILAYVRSCLNSVVLDAVRQAHARQCEVGEQAIAEGAVSQQPAERDEAFWQCIERALPSRRERALVYLRYVLGYRPREVVATHPQVFPDVDEVYRMERNILQRLSRHPALAPWKE